MESTTTNIQSDKEIITLAVQKLVEEFNKLSALTGKLSDDLQNREHNSPLEVLEGMVMVMTQHTAVTAALTSVVVTSLKAAKMLDDKGIKVH